MQGCVAYREVCVEGLRREERKCEIDLSGWIRLWMAIHAFGMLSVNMEPDDSMPAA